MKMLKIVLGVSALGIAALAAGYLAIWSPRDAERRALDEKATRAAMHGQAWAKECGSCHLAYAPALLPFASWVRTLEEQDRHFGEDLGLGAAGVARLLEHARKEPTPSWGAWKIATSVPKGESPLEISTTPFWRAAHASLPDSAFRAPVSAGRHECEACHRDAASGIFHPRMIHMAKDGVAP